MRPRDDPARRRRRRRRSSRRRAARSAIVEYMLGPEAAQAEASRPARRADRGAAHGARRRSAVARGRDLAVGRRRGRRRSRSARGEILGVAALEGQGQDDLFAALSGQRSPGGGEIVVERRSPCKRAAPVRRDPRRPRARARRPPAGAPAAALGRARTSRRRATTASRRWGPINMRDEGRRVRKAIDDAADRHARAAPGAAALGRQPAEGDDRPLARLRLQRAALLRPDARHRRRARSARSTRCCAGSPTTGAAILFFSSELAEFPLVCDRVLTLFGGRVTAELPGAAADEASLLHAMHGLARARAPAA